MRQQLHAARDFAHTTEGILHCFIECGAKRICKPMSRFLVFAVTQKLVKVNRV